MKKFNFNFHLFAEAPQQGYGPLFPNWTGQQTGGYDPIGGPNETPIGGEYEASSWRNGTGQELSAEMKTFYDKVLIRLAEPYLVHDQFGQKRPIPGGNGKTIEFRKFNALPAIPKDRLLDEGITPNGQIYGVSALTATIKQYGGYVTMSDMLNLTAFDNNMAEVSKLLASQAGRISDKITRDILHTGLNVRYAGGKGARSELDDTCTLAIDDIKKAVRDLKRVNAQTIRGDFVAIVHPDTVYDLMKDEEWIDANEYAGSGRIFAGEIGKMYGVRFVESTEAKIVKEGDLPVYGTLVLGENAYGVTSINNGGIQTIAKQLGSGGTADPLNQRSTMGWKLNKTAAILTEEYMIRIEHAASYGASAEAN